MLGHQAGASLFSAVRISRSRKKLSKVRSTTMAAFSDLVPRWRNGRAQDIRCEFKFQRQGQPPLESQPNFDFAFFRLRRPDKK
jgi:hypothetical protein